MEEFSFEEWEWPPGSERRFLIEPFRSKCKVVPGSKSTVVCTIPFRAPYSTGEDLHHLAFIRPGKGTEIVKAVPGLEVAPTYIIAEIGANGQARPKIFKPNTIRSQVENYLYSLRGSYGYYRYFNLSPISCLIGDETGFCIDAKQQSSEFYFLKHYSQQSPAMLYQWLQDQLAVPNSSINFALHWASLNARERYDMLWNLSPSLVQLHQLLLAIIRIQPEFTPSLRFEWRQKRLSFSDSRVYRTYRGRYLQRSEKDKRLEKWGALICAFHALPQFHPTSTPLCLVNLYKTFKVGVYIYNDSPYTECERLEAHALLRDWLQGKASPEEIAMLLPA